MNVTRRTLAVAAGPVLAGTVLATATAGCGSTTPASVTGLPSQITPPATVTHQPLCPAVRQITSLTVSRDDSLPGNHLRFSVPPRLTVTSPRAAQTVAAAVCGLPAWPGPKHGGLPVMVGCPADWGVSYRLTFATRDSRFPEVVAEVSGCQDVTGAGLNRWQGSRPQEPLWTALAKAAGVPESGFRGCRGGAGTSCPKNATYNA